MGRKESNQTNKQIKQCLKDPDKCVIHANVMVQAGDTTVTVGEFKILLEP